MNARNKRAVVIGAGLSGLTVARYLAERGFTVDIYEKRATIGGNVYDYRAKNGIVVQKYGPHIFHTADKEVQDFLFRFGEWIPYEHKVLGYIDGKFVPIPFNLTSLHALFPEDKSDKIERVLRAKIGENKKAPILELKNDRDPLIREFAAYVFEKVFYNYTLKQWGMIPEKLGKNVMNRVPVNVSYNDAYFTDPYQAMPKNGFTAVFTEMIANPRIALHLNSDVLKYENEKLLINGEEISDPLIYTGSPDELFNYKFGELPYRTLRFEFEELPVSSFQDAAVVNYPNDEKFTRITEFSKFACRPQQSTIICREYPAAYRKENGDIPYYPIAIEENLKQYALYKKYAERFSNLYLLGRLAQYEYLNMDACVRNALNTAKKISE